MEIILNYSNYSFIVVGETKQYKDELMKLTGKYNPHLKLSAGGTGPGFVFSNKKEQEVREFIDSVQNNNNSDIFNPIVKKPIIINKTTKLIPKNALPSTSNALDFPNRFTASDGLGYQVIIQTCPLPYLNQKLIINFDNTVYEYIVTNINEGSLVNDITVIHSTDDSSAFRCVIINGKWQIYNMSNVHEITFQI